jgi:hypothetical protein
MARKKRSKITRLPAAEREYVERLMREDRLTLSEMMDAIRTKFPTADVSRSGLGRYQMNFEELAGRSREIDRMADALVENLGESTGDKAGALLAQAVTTLAANAALKAHGDEDISITEIGKLARAAKSAMDARRMSLNERRILRDEARAELAREQAEKLEGVTKRGGLSSEAAEIFRKEILGIAS